MLDESSLAEIQDLNLTYLVLAKQMLAEDRDAAIFRLGLTPDVADYLLSLSAKKLSQLSRSNQLVFSLRFENAVDLEATLQSYRDFLGAPNHHSIVMASVK